MQRTHLLLLVGSAGLVAAILSRRRKRTHQLLCECEPCVHVKWESILALEHINLNVGCTWTDELSDFWFGVVGGADDPRSEKVCKMVREAGGHMESLRWVNIGLQQFHMPVGELTNPVQVVRGEVGLSFDPAGLSALRERLQLAGITHASLSDGVLRFRCPLGNVLSAEAWTGRLTWFGPADLIAPNAVSSLPGGKTAGLGIRYVRFDVPHGVAAGICRFYIEIFGSEASVTERDGRPCCIVPIGCASL
jgi:hypothetical protein